MANPLKQLAGETAVYGLSSILARILNFAFVPIYTRMLTRAQYGVVTEFMAYIAILQVVLGGKGLTQNTVVNRGVWSFYDEPDLGAYT